jgi:hypothetical protein
MPFGGLVIGHVPCHTCLQKLLLALALALAQATNNDMPDFIHASGWE